MKIAVLMSTYNGEKYLDQQLDSLYRQSLRDSMKIYIRDDGSRDRTPDRIRRWADKMDIELYRGENVGPARSFWELFMDDSIRADYYAFCDQDDIWDPDKLEAAVRRLNGNTHLYVCGFRSIDERGRVICARGTSAVPEISVPALFVSGAAQGCAMVFTDALREYVRKMNLTQIPMHDLMLTLYALNYGDFYWDRKPHFSYRMHRENVVAKQNKSGIGKLKSTYSSWIGGSRNPMYLVAKEYMDNCPKLRTETREYLETMSGYKGSIRRKIRLIFYFRKKKAGFDQRALRSYQMRILLGLL